MKLTFDEYQSRNGAGKESWAIAADAQIVGLTTLLKDKEEDLRALLDSVRTAEGELARGNPVSARETLAVAAGHYLSCSWWATSGECDCGGRQ